MAYTCSALYSRWCRKWYNRFSIQFGEEYRIHIPRTYSNVLHVDLGEDDDNDDWPGFLPTLGRVIVVSGKQTLLHFTFLLTGEEEEA